MRILQINSVYDYGSTGKIVKSIHDHLLSNNVDAYVIYGRMGAVGDQKKEVKDEHVFYINNNLEADYHLINSVIFDKHGLYSRRNTQRIIEKIKEIKPDVIHLHNIHGFYLNYRDFFAFLKETKIPVVWTLHDCWAYTGFCSYYDYNECDGFKTGCKNCRFKNVYPYKLFNHAAQNFEIKEKSFLGLKNLTIVTPSNWLANEVKMSFLKGYPIQTIHNDIDLNSFSYKNNFELLKKHNISNRKVCLAVSNVWTSQKGYLEYMKLSEILPDDWVLVMIGLTEKQLAKLPKNVIGIARTSSKEELAQWYSTADVFVNLSLEDNYPTVNIEAQACRLPIIGYKTGGMVEQLIDQDYLVEKYDLNGVVNLLKNTNFSKSNHCFKNDMMNEYMNLYSRVIEK